MNAWMPGVFVLLCLLEVMVCSYIFLADAMVVKGSQETPHYVLTHVWEQVESPTLRSFPLLTLLTA